MKQKIDAKLLLVFVAIIISPAFGQEALRKIYGNEGYHNQSVRTLQSSYLVAQIPRPPAKPNQNDFLQSNCPHRQKGLKRWHDPKTWNLGGSIPRSYTNVTIPLASKVVIDRSIDEIIGLITIPPGSELIIGSNVTGINLSVSGIYVLGRLTAGSPTCRINTRIGITLYGPRPVDATKKIPPHTYKGISVEGGVISMHGKRYYQTWSRLSKTVTVGSTKLVIQERVNWEPGQKIVLVTSAIKDSRDYNQNEELIIRAVKNRPVGSAPGCTISLASPTKYIHTANQYYQVEVGLLTRSITIQGSAADSEPKDKDPLNGSCMDPLADQRSTIYYKTTQPCMNKELTGFGGHVRVANASIGQIQGVEFYRMGQTNVLGHYPMHFHLLSNCPSCYVRDSSFHRSFYRCISIHGTNDVRASENVAFDVVGYCYYLEDGIEERNTLSFNLAAHIHTLGPDLPRGDFEQTDPIFYEEGPNLTLPADVTASGFYITNVNNKIIGNSASGGWSGFAFPGLIVPVGLSKNVQGYFPLNKVGLVFDGNTAHSTGWWWYHTGAIYIGGALYYTEEGKLQYIPGRGFDVRSFRNPCNIDPCLPPYSDCYTCPEKYKAWLQLTNTKVFLTAGVGLNSWSGLLEIVNYEAHDIRLAIEVVSEGFWMDNAFIVCRTGADLGLPSSNAYSLEGSAFYWYDVDQEVIITNTTFRNCGYRSTAFAQYDTSPTRGCGNTSDVRKGCADYSTVIGFLSDADQFAPQVMQATNGISFENCGRRFRFSSNSLDTVSGRGQNWIDIDGTASGFWEPAIIASGLNSVKNWWGADKNSVRDEQGPLYMTKINQGPERRVGYVRIEWDASLHSKVGDELCTDHNVNCPWEGFVRHAGKMFSPFVNPVTVNKGLPLTARGDVVGPIGGFGWIVNFNKTAPRSVILKNPEIVPDSTMIISIPYPKGTTFTIVAKSVSYCSDFGEYVCNINLLKVTSLDLVRKGIGNTYFVDSDGVLTFRMIQTSNNFVGNPNFFKPDYVSPARDVTYDTYAFRHFSRDGITLPRIHPGDQQYHIQAQCPGDTSISPIDGYCSGPVKFNYDPDVCPSGYTQVAYDTCCQTSAPSKCIYANGSKNF